jgi:hypothetical protein
MHNNGSNATVIALKVIVEGSGFVTEAVFCWLSH